MRIIDWSSDVCSSDLEIVDRLLEQTVAPEQEVAAHLQADQPAEIARPDPQGRKVAQIRHHDDVAVAELHGDRADRLRRPAGRRHKTEERRGGKEWVSMGTSRWAQEHNKKKKKT